MCRMLAHGITLADAVCDMAAAGNAASAAQLHDLARSAASLLLRLVTMQTVPPAQAHLRPLKQEWDPVFRAVIKAIRSLGLEAGGLPEAAAHAVLAAVDRLTAAATAHTPRWECAEAAWSCSELLATALPASSTEQRLGCLEGMAAAAAAATRSGTIQGRKETPAHQQSILLVGSSCSLHCSYHLPWS